MPADPLSSTQSACALEETVGPAPPRLQSRAAPFRELPSPARRAGSRHLRRGAPPRDSASEACPSPEASGRRWFLTGPREEANGRAPFGLSSGQIRLRRRQAGPVSSEPANGSDGPAPVGPVVLSGVLRR